MEKKDLIELLNGIFKPLGFKHKGNIWVQNDTELSKMIKLQKSNFGNYYYINYGFIIKAIELNGLYMHLSYRLGSLNKEEQKEITNLLDFEYEIPKEERISTLRQKIELKILPNILKVNNEEDIKNYLKDPSHAYDIPLSVKKYLHIL